MPKVRWVTSNGFCSKIHTLPAVQKIDNQPRFDKVTESLRWELFLRHSVGHGFWWCIIKTCYC